MSPTPKYFLYARKSTDEEDKQVYSIEHQLAELRRRASRKSLHVVAEFIESRSAMTAGRPLFNDMLARIKNGEANGILSWQPDRLTRNSFDGHQILNLIQTQQILHLEFEAFWFEPTPHGVLMLEIAFGISKYYSANHSQNIQRTIRERVRDGYWPHKPPLGYHFDHGTRTIVVDPVAGPLIRKIFELYATGEYTLERLRQTINSLGLVSPKTEKYRGGPLALSRYYYILCNPFYVGMLQHKGQLFEAKHEPLVPYQLFDKCQHVRVRRGKYRSPGLKPFLYRGLFSCGECGGSITMEIQKGHHYLRCTKKKGPCFQRFVREDEVNKQVSRILTNLSVPQLMIDSMLAELEAEQQKEVATWNEEIARIKSRLQEFDTRFQRLGEAYVDGVLPLGNFNQAKQKLLQQKQTWIEKLEFAQSHRKTPLEPAIAFIRGLTEARIVAHGDNMAKKRDWLQKVGSNLKIFNQRVLQSARGPWKYVAETARLARRHAATCSACASGNAPFSKKCPEFGAGRTATACHQFFKDTPAWA
jgi:DNA invertase Pin-like site-specific DNA recombinase